MRSSFYDYYPPGDDQYKQLWEEALIVLDTNVLLNLYRLPTAARDDLFGVLDSLKARLWIPHQVALEFQRRRLSVIAKERKSVEEVLKFASSLVDGIKSKVEKLEIDKRGLGISSKPLLDELEQANQKLLEAIRATHSAQQDISGDDNVRSRLDDLFEGRVGGKPNDQAALDAMISDGEERYKEKIPPGFADVEKEKNPNEAVFIFDRIKFQRKFGDLILWKQLLEKLKTEKFEAVLFITGDRKEDWWRREEGQTVGPHPELVREIEREGGVKLFWMYTSDQFVEHANLYFRAKVSSESVNEIKQIASVGPVFSRSIDKFSMKSFDSVNQSIAEISDFGGLNEIERGVGRWLQTMGRRVRRDVKGSPDFVVIEETGLHGYEVRYSADIAGYLKSRRIRSGLSVANRIVNNVEISKLTLVIVTDEDRVQSIYKLDDLVMKVAAEFSLKYEVDAILIGYLDDGVFLPMMEYEHDVNGDDDEGDFY